MFGLSPALVVDLKSPGHMFNLFRRICKSLHINKCTAMARMNDQIKPIIKIKTGVSKVKD